MGKIMGKNTKKGGKQSASRAAQEHARLVRGNSSAALFAVILVLYVVAMLIVFAA